MNKNKIKVGWYAFECGKFSENPEAYPNCQGVVAYLNSDPNAPTGQRGLILTPDAVRGTWSDEYCKTKICDEEDGRCNTEDLIAFAKEYEISFFAAEWCALYSKNGIKAGEGFLPAKIQLKQVTAHRKVINLALERIGGTILDGWMWSSSECDEYSSMNAWMVNEDGFAHWGDKCKETASVRCFLAF